jgi:hypothetical protein
VQVRFAAVERRMKELAEVFVKYEKANIERLEVSKCLPPIVLVCSAGRAHSGLVTTASF